MARQVDRPGRIFEVLRYSMGPGNNDDYHWIVLRSRVGEEAFIRTYRLRFDHGSGVATEMEAVEEDPEHSISVKSSVHLYMLPERLLGEFDDMVSNVPISTDGRDPTQENEDADHKVSHVWKAQVIKGLEALLSTHGLLKWGPIE